MARPAPDMTKVEVLLPEDVAKLLRDGDEGLPARAREAIILHLFQTEKVSAGFAAEALGLDLRDFHALLDRRGIPLLHYEDKEVDALKAT